MLPHRLPRIRRLAVPALLAALALVLLAAPDAFAGIISPENRGGSPNAEKIQLLYRIVFWIGMVIFLLVEGVLIYSIVKFRRRRGGPEPQQVRGNTRLEVGWTIGAASILVVLAAVTFAFLSGIQDPAPSLPNGLVAEHKADSRTELASVNQPPPPGPPNRHLEIGVNGQQYLWRYTYPAFNGQQVFNYYDMYVPVGTTVVLTVTSSDVDHAWWIPALGGSVQALPGHPNKTWFRISQPGVYTGQCVQLCGKNHADMRARVIAVPVDRFKAWEAGQAASIQQSQAYLAIARKLRGQAGGSTPNSQTP